MDLKKAIVKRDHESVHYLCPKCSELILSAKNMRQSGEKDSFCKSCGQGIDWSFVRIETYWPQ